MSYSDTDSDVSTTVPVPTTLELKKWAKGPTMKSLFGDRFPLARDHLDWRPLEIENDQWVEEHWEFDDSEVRDYLMQSFHSGDIGFPFSERGKLLWICRLVTLLFVLDEDLDRHRNLHLLPILKGLTDGTRKPEDNYAEIAINKCWRAIEETSDPLPRPNSLRIIRAYFMWACLRYGLGINLTDEELAHPLIQRLEDIAGFHVAYTNDLISYTKEYLTDTATNNILTLLQRNDGLTAEEAETKLRLEIRKSELEYRKAALAVLDDPVLGKKEDIRKLVLNIPYGMGGNAWWSLVILLHHEFACSVLGESEANGAAQKDSYGGPLWTKS
ncbi:hypothetical protein WG66_004627 [Moniliophthora roreri]|nr:hypothetical protein WG66_004627 [Moniliophthora roreri]